LSVEVDVDVKSSRGNAGLLGAKRRLCVQACSKRPIVSGRMMKIWREATSTAQKRINAVTLRLGRMKKKK
jgi:hypothetical protein